VREIRVQRYVIASSPEMASRNRNGALLSFEDEGTAWRELASRQRVYPRAAGFAVFRADIHVTECEPPITEEKHEEVYGLDVNDPANG
jgi:hypothetical protein